MAVWDVETLWFRLITGFGLLLTFVLIRRIKVIFVSL